MRKFLRGLWDRFKAWIRNLPPVRFFLEDPADRPIGEIVVSFSESKKPLEVLFEHIEPLRSHLLWSVGILLVAVALSFTQTRTLSKIIAQPPDLLGRLASIDLAAIDLTDPQSAFQALKAAVTQPSDPPGGLAAIDLTTVDVTESLSVFMRIALLSGLILALPFIAFMVWHFVAPGLRPAQKLKSLFDIPLSTVLFVAGAAFSYFFILPAALSAMRFFNDYMGFVTEWRPDSYFRFSTGLLFWMGIGFEFPILIKALTGIGILNPKVLVTQWRLAVVIIAILAAMITPTVDPITMSLVMLPLFLLYWIGVGLGYLSYNKKEEPGKQPKQT